MASETETVNASVRTAQLLVAGLRMMGCCARPSRSLAPMACAFPASAIVIDLGRTGSGWDKL